MFVGIAIETLEMLREGARFTTALERHASAALDAAGREVLAHLNGGQYYQRRTGTMERKLRLVGDGPLAREVRAEAPYAKWIDEGTKPHDIRPTRAKALRFVQNGAVRFAAVVHHPGTKPTSFAEGERAFLEAYLPPLAAGAADDAIGESGVG